MKRITATVPDDLLPKLLALIAESKLDSFTVETVDDPRRARAAKPRRTRHAVPSIGPPEYRSGINRVIMSHYGTGLSFTSAIAERWAADAGFKTASPALSALVKLGYLRRPSYGHFEFVKPFPTEILAAIRAGAAAGGQKKT